MNCFDWGFTELKLRGNFDVEFTALLTEVDEARFKFLLAQGEENGVWEASDYPTAYKMKENGHDIPDEIKKQILDNFKK